MTPSPLPPLHVVTDDAVVGRADFLDVARAVLAAGGGSLVLHLRGPRTPAARLHAIAGALVPDARAAGALLLANDRVDLALALPLDGVHLGDRSLPADVARRLLGAGAWIGRSAHGPGAALEGVGQGADFLLVGTVFASGSHPGRAPGGVDLVRRVRAAASLPLVAIGGVTPGRIHEVRAAGADGVAALSGVWDAPEPAGAVEGYLEALAAPRDEVR